MMRHSKRRDNNGKDESTKKIGGHIEMAANLK